MKQGRFLEAKIVGILCEAEKGEKPIADLCRENMVLLGRRFTASGVGTAAEL
jgi:hypothetical protein